MLHDYIFRFISTWKVSPPSYLWNKTFPSVLTVLLMGREWGCFILEGVLSRRWHKWLFSFVEKGRGDDNDVVYYTTGGTTPTIWWWWNLLLVRRRKSSCRPCVCSSLVLLSLSIPWQNARRTSQSLFGVLRLLEAMAHLYETVEVFYSLSSLLWWRKKALSL